MAKQKIPCRVCGKLFEPCAYCKAHEDVFRWRNFACSKECASKYIEDTVAYRESLKCKADKNLKLVETISENNSTRKTHAAKKIIKKNSTDIIENIAESEKEKL